MMRTATGRLAALGPPVAQVSASPARSLRNDMRTMSPSGTRMVGAMIGNFPILLVDRGAAVSR